VAKSGMLPIRELQCDSDLMEPCEQRELRESEREAGLSGAVNALLLIATPRAEGDGAASALLRTALDILRCCGAEHKKQLWKSSLVQHGANDSFLLRFLGSSNEGIAGMASQLACQARGVGDTLRTITLRCPRGDRAVHVLEVGPGGVQEGGLLWPSAVLMARRMWMGQWPYTVDWTSGRVLEVGCGTCGLPGIVAGLLRSKEVVMTDYMQELLSAASANWLQNRVCDRCSTLHKSGPTPLQCLDCGTLTHVSTALMDWNDIEGSERRSSFTLAKGSFDYILGADIVYDKEHAVPVANCLRHFLREAPHARVFVTMGDHVARKGIEVRPLVPTTKLSLLLLLLLPLLLSLLGLPAAHAVRRLCRGAHGRRQRADGTRVPPAVGEL
jgi:predicted nicotinamide N-methyase